jgi:hypothetical protein
MESLHDVENQQQQQPDGISFGLPLSDQFYADALSLLYISLSSLLVWGVAKLRAKVVKLSKVVENSGVIDDILPKEEIARIKEILAQLAIIYDADRVTLGVLHNGVIGSTGAHYDKMAIVAGYSSPGIIPLPEIAKDINVTTIMSELKPLSVGDQDELFLKREDAPSSCSLYMARRDIFHLWNKLLSIGNIEVGVISFHWCSNLETLPFPPPDSKGDVKSQELIKEIVSIIRLYKERRKILG